MSTGGSFFWICSNSCECGESAANVFCGLQTIGKAEDGGVARERNYQLLTFDIENALDIVNRQRRVIPSFLLHHFSAQVSELVAREVVGPMNHTCTSVDLQLLKEIVEVERVEHRIEIGRNTNNNHFFLWLDEKSCLYPPWAQIRT